MEVSSGQIIESPGLFNVNNFRSLFFTRLSIQTNWRWTLNPNSVLQSLHSPTEHALRVSHKLSDHTDHFGWCIIFCQRSSIDSGFLSFFLFFFPLFFFFSFLSFFCFFVDIRFVGNSPGLIETYDHWDTSTRAARQRSILRKAVTNLAQPNVTSKREYCTRITRRITEFRRNKLPIK